MGRPAKGMDWKFGALGATFVACLLAVQWVDFSWTLYLEEHPWPRLIDFMGRTIFEGQAFGGGDLVILYLMGILGAYYASWKGSSTRLLPHRPCFGFVIASSVVFALGLVHALKWSMGRARPYEVLHAGLPFSPWYSFGPHFVTEGIYHGSFPSGHTAQAAILLTLFYLLAGDPMGSRRARCWAGWSLGVLALGFTLVMGIARCMSLSHWLTDVVAGLFTTWLGMHFMYHRLLRVPDQMRFFDLYGRLPMAPQVWELRLSAWLLGAAAAAAGIVLGARALWEPRSAALGLMIPIGGLLLWFCLKRVRSLYQTAFRELDSDRP